MPCPPPSGERCQLLFLCSPGNPIGAVMTAAYLRRALELAERHDFVIASDECYAEIYDDEAQPPPGAAAGRAATGNRGFERCVVFHSLSKRSSVPGLRSGFVAGDAALIGAFLLYRTYHGCAMPVPTQLASIPAWNDEAHVRREPRAVPRQVRRGAADAARRCSRSTRPAGGFYLWLRGRRRRGLHARPVRAAERHRAAGQLPGARDAGAAIPGAGACASRSSRASTNASRLRGASRVRAIRSLTDHRRAILDLRCFAIRRELTDEHPCDARRHHRRRLRGARELRAGQRAGRRRWPRSTTASTCSTRGAARVAEKRRRPVGRSTNG